MNRVTVAELGHAHRSQRTVIASSGDGVGSPSVWRSETEFPETSGKKGAPVEKGTASKGKQGKTAINTGMESS